MIDTLVGASVDESDVFAFECFSRERVVVIVEAARQPPTAVEYKRTHHGPCRIAVLFEGLRDSVELGREWLPGKVLHAILERVRSRENGRMRRPRQRHLRKGALVDDAIVTK